MSKIGPPNPLYPPPNFYFFPGYPLLVIVQILLILVSCLKKLFVSVFLYCHFFLECCRSIMIILDKFLLLAVSLFSFPLIWLQLDCGRLVQFRTFFPATFIVLLLLWTEFLTFLVFIHAALHLYLYYISSVTCYLCIYVVSVVFCIFECSAHITLAFTCVIL